MDFLVAATPSTYETGRGLLFSERHLKELGQRRIRHQINEALLMIQYDPAFQSHADHFEFLFREHILSQTSERRASIHAQVDHYVRLLADNSATMSEGHTMKVLNKSKVGNVSQEEFTNTLEYLAYLIEMASTPAIKLKAYVQMYEFFMTQPIIMMASPSVREQATNNLINMLQEATTHREDLHSLQTRFTQFLQSLRVHPYYKS